MDFVLEDDSVQYFSPNKAIRELQRHQQKKSRHSCFDFLMGIFEDFYNLFLVVLGETSFASCGKTTQIPQFILEDEISARISSEWGENLGETVSYQIRLESKRSAQTRLLFGTTGVSLRQLVKDPQWTGVSHLLVDEIHERGMNEDFLIIILRDLLPRRPYLRLILMSATINVDLFSKYFGNAPATHIPGLTFHVAELFLEDVLEKTHYVIKSESDKFERGNSKRRRRQQDTKKDPLTELFEVEATVEHICRHERDGVVLVFLTGWVDIKITLQN